MRVEASARFQLVSWSAIGLLLLMLVQPRAPGQPPGTGGRNDAMLRMRSLAPEPPATNGTPQGVKIEPLSFMGVKIGASTLDEVAAAWGAPRQSVPHETIAQQTFAVEPFDRIEATFYRGVILTATVVLRESLPLDEVVQRLELSGLTPAVLRDLTGKPSGRAYPERGASLLFADAAQRTVQQVILDTLDAPPFVLRGEQHLSREPTRALADADSAIRVDERSGRAWRLRGEALLKLGRPTDAMAAADQATTVESEHPAPRLLLARAMHEAGQRVEAIEIAQQAVKLAADRPEAKAAALVCVGDRLLEGSTDDVQRALNYFQQAITAADAARNSDSFETRRAAGEAIVAAHLGAADAISRANWQNKPQAVSRWLEQAVQAAQDVYAQEPEALADAAFAIGVRATAIATRLNGLLDVRSWADDCRTLADQRLAGVTGAEDRLTILRDLVTAYDHVAQSAQRRQETEIALKYAQQALTTWQEVTSRQARSPRDQQLLGELNFRVGSCHAILKQDHPQAVSWFDKARPNLELSAEKQPPREPARLGETMVSMAVSYWAVGQQQPALELTQRGLGWMKQAVDAGQLDRAALHVPYGNLARMYQHRGDLQKAAEYQSLAGKPDGKVLR